MFLNSVGPVFGKVPLRVLLVIPFVLQIFGSVGLVGYLSFRSGQKAVNNVATQLRNEVTTRVRQHLQSYLDPPRLVAQTNARAGKLGNLGFDNLLESEEYLWEQIQLYDSIYATYVGSEEGQFIYVKREENGTYTAKVVEEAPDRLVYPLDGRGKRLEPLKRLEVDRYNPTERPWYLQTVASKRTNWSEIYSFAGGELGITVSEPFYDPRGEFRGVIGVDLILTLIGDFLESIQISSHGQVFIMERSGGLVATSTGEEPFAIAAGEKKAQQIAAADSKNPLTQATADYLSQHYGNFSTLKAIAQTDFEFENQRQYVQIAPYRDQLGLDWLIVVVVPERDFMGQIHANRRTTVWLCLAALGVATVVGLLTTHWIVAPIARVVEATQGIANGELDKRVEVENVKELQILAQSFNRMAAQLRDSFHALEQANADLEERVRQRTADLQAEQEKSEQLLLNILPETIATQLKQSQRAIAQHFDEVTILFADIVGFTPLSARLTPIELVNFLNQMFSSFDALAERYGLEKIKTIGDAYMVAAGLPLPRADHAEAIADMALEILAAIQRFNTEQGENFQIRIGINTGVVVAGVIGTKKFIYDLWGDAVNVASRMESSGEPGEIQVTATTYNLLKEKYIFEERGAVQIKGKGEMLAYWLRGKISGGGEESLAERGSFEWLNCPQNFV